MNFIYKCVEWQWLLERKMHNARTLSADEWWFVGTRCGRDKYTIHTNAGWFPNWEQILMLIFVDNENERLFWLVLGSNLSNIIIMYDFQFMQVGKRWALMHGWCLVPYMIADHLNYIFKICWPSRRIRNCACEERDIKLTPHRIKAAWINICKMQKTHHLKCKY